MRKAVYVLYLPLVVDFDPYQAADITADPEIPTIQYKHEGTNLLGMGWLANKTEKGLSDEQVKTNTGSSTGHSIFSFFNEIDKISVGTYKWDGTKWVKVQKQ